MITVDRRVVLLITLFVFLVVGIFSYMTWVQSPPDYPRAKLVRAASVLPPVARNV